MSIYRIVRMRIVLILLIIVAISGCAASGELQPVAWDLPEIMCFPEGGCITNFRFE